MDKRFIAHHDYLKNRASISCVELDALLSMVLPRRLDTLEIIDRPPSKGSYDYSDPNLIPIGDLNWVRNWMSFVPNAADPKLTPLEIPKPMMRYLNREYIHLYGRDIDKEHSDASRYFIKDIDRLKSFNSALYDWDVSHLIERDTLYSVSEKVSFLSEWRVFVYEDVEQGAQHYLGDPMIFPDTDTIHEMIVAWRDSLERRPRAYTLDVGVMVGKESGERVTSPIEVHPFVSCGLYGFSDSVIPDMLVAGYEWYRDEAI